MTPIAFHALFEMLAYSSGFYFYLWLRKQNPDGLDSKTRLTHMAGAILGAAIGSKLLGIAEHSELWPLLTKSPIVFLSAKTILGAIIGGTIGVEIAKSTTGITKSTGDLYVYPLIIAISVGRVGCFLMGADDGTWGNKAIGLFAMDSGHGELRYPTPLFEIVFLILLGLILRLFQSRQNLINGLLFKLFILSYCGFRFCIEFIKPVTVWPPLNLSMIQMVAMLTIIVYTVLIARELNLKVN